jgi:hypothetical protein
MKIYELRKVASKNKKYKYIYQLILDGKVAGTRKSNVDYLGCTVRDGGPVRYFQTLALAQLLTSLPVDIALTFEGLLQYLKPNK